MSTPHDPTSGDPTADEPADNVVPFTGRSNRQMHRPDDQRDDRIDPADAEDTEEQADAESFDDRPPELGGLVDPADEVPAEVLARRRQRRPILAEWARSRRAFTAMARHQAKDAAYVLAYHGVRLPKYGAKSAVYAPAGLLRGTGRLLRWAVAEEGNWALRQVAAQRGDADLWLRLDARRQLQARWRIGVLITGTIAGAVGVALLGVLAPPVWRLVALAVMVPVLARVGRPADRPLTDRVTDTGRYRRLTADLVRRGLTSIQLAAINSAVGKDPNAITFPQEIHRDGPGHLAIIDLPYGVEAADVIARRGRLASAMRLPLDQVWPEPAPGHPGRLGLWVGYEPASAMKQPAWPLLGSGTVDLFKPFPFATTPRLDTVEVGLPFRNFLFGGQPGSGKTFALRILVLAAALDPRAEIRGYELKGVGDFAALEPVLSEYGNGFDDDTLTACAAFVEWLYEECRRRSKRIEHYARLGKAPENKVTPELAALPGSGLHLLVGFIDEIQELMTSKHGKDAGELIEKVIKLGRALGVILLIGTQIPDKDSLPTGITRNVNSRFCLSVADQTANDMILGTSAYKNGYRATVFQPGVEAGWGILAGFGKPSAVHSFEVDSDAARRVVTRAVAARQKSGTLPPAADRTRPAAPAFDLLGDLLHVWPDGQDKAWNDTLCGLLAELRPDVYGGWEAAGLTTALRPYPAVRVVDVGRRIDGKPVTRRGITRADVQTAVAERDRPART